ncbi:DUF6884 domain-containing protein [Camelliibacillus cellulosilyticus]|uniref:DUF6884 domain-containing protein n=1 Tax=Camelliibacillus cellulosilyticus TaxID=2174486 RepID=A0ABV9GL91_9BACL
MVGLFATARKKADHPAKVVDFYISPLFIKSVEYARLYYDRYYFYNAKDGLLLPDDFMTPYDVSIRTFSQSEKQAWAARVVEAFARYEKPGPIELFLHGGSVYRKYLEPALTAYGFTFTVPLEGMSIGKQLKWYQEKIAVAEGDKN